MDQLFARLGETETLEAESEGQVDVVTLLRLALKSELEASELAGFWLPTTPEVDAKMALALQCGDEMKHYGLISQRLAELGEDLDRLRSAGRRPQPALPVPARPAHHGRADRRRPLRQRGDRRDPQRPVRRLLPLGGRRRRPPSLYDETIQPEEVHHHHLGREILEKYATTPELQELAAAAVRNTLAIADELRNLAAKTTGVHNIPVS